jgi:hypothetical protein
MGGDSIWGTAAYNTFFRNWALGTTMNCNPYAGRGTPTCSPMGYAGYGTSNGWWAAYASEGISLWYKTTYTNLVGNAVGSTAMENLKNYIVGPGIFTVTPVGAIYWPTARDSEYNAYGYSFGYLHVTNDGSGGGSTDPYTTLFWHGDYNDITKSVMRWETGVPHTLPASFYLSSRPSWWSSALPYPAIGPDVSSGAGASGHADYIPAEYCFYKMIGGNQGGAGSPLTFNADACYKSASVVNLRNLQFSGMSIK